MDKGTRRLKRAARKAGKPLRQFARWVVRSLPMSDGAIDAREWMARKGLGRG